MITENNRLTELSNKLFNVKPSERIVKELMGEIVIPPKNAINLFENLNQFRNEISKDSKKDE